MMDGDLHRRELCASSEPNATTEGSGTSSTWTIVDRRRAIEARISDQTADQCAGKLSAVKAINIMDAAFWRYLDAFEFIEERPGWEFQCLILLDGMSVALETFNILNNNPSKWVGYTITKATDSMVCKIVDHIVGRRSMIQIVAADAMETLVLDDMERQGLL